MLAKLMTFSSVGFLAIFLFIDKWLVLMVSPNMHTE